MNCSLKPSCILVFIMLTIMSVSAEDYRIIPLLYRDVPLENDPTIFEKRLIIFVGINGGKPYPYLFDTGSSGFNAAYYNEDRDNPFHWDFTEYYDGFEPEGVYAGTFYTGGFGDLIKPCYVPQIEIYSPYNLETPAVILKATDVDPDSKGYIVNQQWQSLSKATDPDNYDWKTRDGHKYVFNQKWYQKVANGEPPVNDYSAGTFGAGIFTGKNVSNPEGLTFTNSSVLGQSTRSGWAVVANQNSTVAYVILGLDESSIRHQFTTVLPWKTPTTEPNPFPNSDANSGTEYGVGEFTVTLSRNGATPVSWSMFVSTDTGTPEYDLGFSGTSAQANILSNSYFVDDSSTIKSGTSSLVSGSTDNAELYTYLTTFNTSDYITNRTSVDTSSLESTLGIGFFMQNAIGFDLSSKETAYTSSTQVGLPASINPYTEELSPALKSSVPFGPDTFLSSWLGLFKKPDDSGFFLSRDMGWLYPDPTSNDNGLWLWSNNLGSWIWGSTTSGRYLYLNSTGNWIYIYSYTDGGSFYYDVQTNTWAYVPM